MQAVSDDGGSNSWLSKMENLLDPDGCSSRHGGVLPEHRDAGLTPQQQAEDYAQFISRISREYVPLTKAKLPARVQEAFNNAPCEGHPVYEEHEIYKILSERKLTGGVSGDLDLDPRVTRACLVELAYPIGCVYNEAITTHEWPHKWKEEHQIMILKCPGRYEKPRLEHIFQQWIGEGSG